MPLLRLLAAPFVNVWRFWTEPVRAEPLAAFRILLGLTIIANLLTGFIWRLPSAVGPDGLIPAKTRDSWLARGGRVCLLRGPTGLPLLGDWLPTDAFGHGISPWAENWVPKDTVYAWKAWGERPSSAYILFAVYLLSLAMMTVGLFTRLSTFVAVLMAATFNNYLSEYINGGDFLLRNGLWLLLLSPAGATWSLDARYWPPKEQGPVMIAPWSVRLMQIQICFMYLFVGLTKLDDIHFDKPTWWASLDVVDGLAKVGSSHFSSGSWWPRGDWLDGEALYWVMNDVAITRWSYAQMPMPYAVCKVLTWGTLIFEIGFPVFVLWKWTRIPLLLSGVLLHLGILITLEIGWFSQVTLCFYVLFLSGDTVDAAARWLSGTPREEEDAHG
jgi:hypothetical protein